MTVEKKIENLAPGAASGAGAASAGKIAPFLSDIEPFFHRRPLVYVDVGAHRGDIFAELCASPLKLHEAHLIEPNPKSFAALERAVAALDPARNATCHHLALSDRPGRLRLRDADTMTKVIGDADTTKVIGDADTTKVIGDADTTKAIADADATEAIGAATTRAIGGADAATDARTFEVEARTLDDLAQGFVIPRISLLKIDVEGHEAAVLAGARRLLEAEAIDIVYIEAGLDPDGAQQTYYRAIEDQLRPYGYRLFRIYEQMHEWLEDSPLLRRANLAFMSAGFAARNPYRLSQDLMALRKDKDRLKGAVTGHLAEIARLTRALEAERAAAAAAAEARERKLQAAAIELDRAAAAQRTLEAKRDAAQTAQRAVEAERDAAERKLEAERDAAQTAERKLEAERDAAQRKLAAGRDAAQAAQRKLEAERDAATAEAAAQRRAERDRQAEAARALQAAQSELGLVRAYGRELEVRLVGMLESRSWRVLEPARRLSRRLTGRKTPQPFAPKLAAGGALVDPKAPAAPAAGGLPVADLVAKLWGGFSASAQVDLAGVMNDATRPGPDRVAAAWNLARSHAAARDWAGCLACLMKIAHVDKKFFRARRTRILLIETYARVGEPDRAIEYAEHGLQGGGDGNFQCGVANALLAKDPSGGQDGARLDRLNRIYRAAGLAPVALVDPARGLVFGNLATELEAGAAPAAANGAANGAGGPKISVLMAVYNAGGFIETAIGSLLAQTWRNLEIVAVDDASPDDSWAKLERLAARDPRLRLFRNEVNLGAYPTRNRALGEATGDIVTVHDSDDWSHAQMLDVQATALLQGPEVKATFSAMARVQPHLEFALRPERNNLEYVHRSYPSLMLRREDLARLSQWDGVSANADDEMVQRARAVWGDKALEDVLPGVPLSLFLSHGQSLTEQKGTHLKSLSFGIRREYAQAAEFWRRSTPEALAAGAPMARTDMKTPFPIPAGLAPKHWPKNPVYDLVLVSDLGLLGGTRRCNEAYAEAAADLGMRVGLYHWPRYDLRLSQIAPEYRRLSYRPEVDILVPEDEIAADTVLIHHPPILKHRIDAAPRIAAERVAVLVNQLPMQLRGDPPHYYFPDAVAALCAELFGHAPVWLPISPLCRRVLAETGHAPLAEVDWLPPLGRDLPEAGPPPRPGGRDDIGAARPIVLGRHSRDHWTKWPASAEAVASAYCADTDLDVRLMGGAQGALKLLKRTPPNWTALGFDAAPVESFLGELDFFLHFTHADYIEEFGRNVMEAMAQGVPAILPPPFAETFGDAAIYCGPEAVAATARRVWADPAGYRAQAAKGYAFVSRTSARPAVAERLAGLVRSRSAAAAGAGAG